MTDSIPQLILGLLAAGAVGALIGWWWRARHDDTEMAAVDERWAGINRMLARDRDRLRAARDRTSQEFALLRRELDARGVRLREVEAERDSAASIAATARVSLDGLRKRLEQAHELQRDRERELGSLQRELGSKAMAVETLYTELAVAQDSRRLLDGELQAADSRIARLESTLRVRDERIERLEDEREQVAVLRQELDERSRRIALLEDGQAADSRRADRVEALEDQLADLERDNERTAAELEALRVQYRTSEERKRSLEKRLLEVENQTGRRFPTTPIEARPVAVADRPGWLLARPDGEVDDLTKIHGVGVALQRTMNALGIYHFRQIAAWGRRDIEWAAERIDASPRRDLDRWIDQAATLHVEKYGHRPVIGRGPGR